MINVRHPVGIYTAFPTSMPRLVAGFLLGWVLAFGLLILSIAIHGAPEQHTGAFYHRVVTWERLALYRTYDLRHYLTGIILFAGFPFIIFICFERLSQLKHKLSRWMIFGICAGGLILFIFFLWMNKDRIHEIVTLLYTRKRGKHLLDAIIFFPLIFFTWTIIYSALRVGYRLPRKQYQKTKNAIARVRMWIIDVCFCVLCSALVFNPRYEYAFQKLAYYGDEGNHQFYHTRSYIGPIHDIVSGKTLLVDSTAQYGYLATLVPAVLFSGSGTFFVSFNLYVVLISTLYVVFVYAFLRRCTHNPWWAGIGTLLYVKLSYYRPFWPEEIYVYPSTTPLRYFPDIFVLHAVVWAADRLSWRRDALLVWLLAAGFFYVPEIGMALLAAYVGYITIRSSIFWNQHKLTAGFLLRSILFPISALLLMAAAIAIGTYLRAGSWPQWWRLFFFIRYFASGYLDIPMPLVGAYYAVLSIYLVTYAVIVSSVHKRMFDQLPLLTFLLVYGLGSFVYYLGFNEPHHLATVLHPSIFLTVLLAYRFRGVIGKVSLLPAGSQSVILTYILILLLFFLWKPLQFCTDVYRRFLSRYGPLVQHYHYWNYYGAGFYLTDNDGKDFSRAVSAIHHYSAGEKRILVLSRYDTLLQIMAGKTGILPYSYLEHGIVYTADVQQAIRRLQYLLPAYVFVFSERYKQQNTTNLPLLWGAIRGQYTFVEHAGAVDVYRLQRH